MQDIVRLIEPYLGSQPWWVYAALLLIPVCIFITLRELACWFFKTNKTVRRVHRLESRITRLEHALENYLAFVEAEQKQEPKAPYSTGTRTAANTDKENKESSRESSRMSGPDQVDEEYTLK